MEGSAEEPPAGGPWMHADTVRRLLTQLRVDIDKQDAHGRTLLHWQVLSGNTSMVAALLAAGGAVDPRTHEGNTPLHMAASRNQSGIMHQLLSHGADINSKSAKDLTPLHYAAHARGAEAVRLLLKAGADAHRGDSGGRTPLHHVVKLYDVPFTRLLLEAGADPNRVDHSGKTALHHTVGPRQPRWTAASEQTDIVKRCETLRCLIKSGGDVNRVDTYGCLPLHIALYFGHRPCLWVLLRAGATVDMDKIIKIQPRAFTAAYKDTEDEAPLPLNVVHLLECLESAFRYVKKLDAAGGYESLVRTYRQVLTAPRHGCLTRYLRQRFGRDAPHDVAVHVLAFWKPPGGP